MNEKQIATLESHGPGWMLQGSSHCPGSKVHPSPLTGPACPSSCPRIPRLLPAHALPSLLASPSWASCADTVPTPHPPSGQVLLTFLVSGYTLLPGAPLLAPQTWRRRGRTHCVRLLALRCPAPFHTPLPLDWPAFLNWVAHLAHLSDRQAPFLPSWAALRSATHISTFIRG